VTGKDHTITNNTVTDYGLLSVGGCICSISGDGWTSISGNTVRKTTGALWDGIIPDKKDSLGANTLIGVY
jgi:hypothetical protein